MIRLIVFLIVAVGLSLVAAWFADHPGQVSLIWQGLQIETSVGVLALAVLLFGIVLVVLFELLRLLLRAPQRFGQRRRRARVDRGYQALAQGLVAAAAGDVAAAKALNRRADKLLDHAPVDAPFSAQAAQLDGDEGAARQTFQRMLKHGETEFLGLRGLLAQAIKDGDSATALKLARRAYLRRPNTPWVLTTLFDLQTQAGLWTEALSTVGEMARYELIDRATAIRQRAILFHQQAASERKAGRPYEALRLARKAHKLLPSLAPLAVLATELAEQTNQTRLARKIIEAGWRAEPHPALARAYLAQVAGQPPAERLKARRASVPAGARARPKRSGAGRAGACGRAVADRTHRPGTRAQAGAERVGLPSARGGRAGRGPGREGARLARQGGRCAAGPGLALQGDRGGARALVAVRSGRPLRQPALGLAAQDRTPAARGRRGAADPARGRARARAPTAAPRRAPPRPSHGAVTTVVGPDVRARHPRDRGRPRPILTRRLPTGDPRRLSGARRTLTAGRPPGTSSHLAGPE